jgi:hypothetical protein
MPLNPCPLCGCSLRNHGDDFCNRCGKCGGKTFEARRKYVAGDTLPPALEALEPLLNALGFLWLYRSKSWGIVDRKSTRRVRAGLCETEAAEFVVSLAVAILKDRRKRLEDIRDTLGTADRLTKEPPPLSTLRLWS